MAVGDFFKREKLKFGKFLIGENCLTKKLSENAQTEFFVLRDGQGILVIRFHHHHMRTFLARHHPTRLFEFLTTRSPHFEMR